MWESMHFRNAWRRGLEDIPVPRGVWLDSSGAKNVLSVSYCLINSFGVHLVSARSKWGYLLEDGKVWVRVCFVEC